MELRHLRYFRAVAELLNFSRAAEQLRVAQPALSRQVRDLEGELGVQLLDRNRVRVELTDAGRTFYRHACKVLADVETAVASVHEAVAGTSGELIICNDWRLSNRDVLGALAEFRQRYPRVQVTLRDLHVHEQLSAIRGRRAHLGCIAGRELAADPDLDSLSLLTSDIMVALSASHRLAGAGHVRLADLADETWLITGEKESPGLREFVTQICRLSGFTPTFSEAAHNLPGMMARVATGFGVCLVPEFLTDAIPADPLVCYVRSDSPPLELKAVWHRRESSKLLQQFLAVLRAKVAERRQKLAQPRRARARAASAKPSPTRRTSAA
jgi:DNA-binding transcriptional LysR family regulator